MTAIDAPRCQYKPEDGAQCGRPALRWLRFCDFHQLQLKRSARKIAERDRQRWFESVNLHDPKSVQRAIQQVTQRLLDGRIDRHRAGQLLYTLQTAIVDAGTNSAPANETCSSG
jgi:hypothetical protein